jgi:hypothetical protein
MKRLLDTPAPRYGSLHRDEVAPLAEVARRMGWKDKVISDVQKAGLQCVVIGRMKYTTGRAVLEFVERLMQEAGDNGQGGRPDEQV